MKRNYLWLNVKGNNGIRSLLAKILLNFILKQLGLDLIEIKNNAVPQLIVGCFLTHQTQWATREK